MGKDGRKFSEPLLSPHQCRPTALGQLRYYSLLRPNGTACPLAPRFNAGSSGCAQHPECRRYGTCADRMKRPAATTSEFVCAVPLGLERERWTAPNPGVNSWAERVPCLRHCTLDHCSGKGNATRQTGARVFRETLSAPSKQEQVGRLGPSRKRILSGFAPRIQYSPGGNDPPYYSNYPKSVGKDGRGLPEPLLSPYQCRPTAL